MGLISAMTAAMHALADAAKAFPLWLAWRITGDIERLQKQIIDHENRGTPADRAAADLLRSKLAYRRRLHAALLAADAGDSGGQRDPNEARRLPGANR